MAIDNSLKTSDRLEDIRFSTLQSVAIYGFWEKVEITEKVHEELSKLGPEGKSVLHKAAQFNKLSLVPKELFTQESLMIKSKANQTVLHIAASHNDQLRHIPKEFLTKENLKSKDIESNTVLHMAAYGLGLSLIDQKEIDTDTLLEENIYNRSPLDLLFHASSEHLTRSEKIDPLKDKYSKLIKEILDLLPADKLKEVYRNQKVRNWKNLEAKKVITKYIAQAIIAKAIPDLKNSNRSTHLNILEV
jgi:hypothetical protein